MELVLFGALLLLIVSKTLVLATLIGFVQAR